MYVKAWEFNEETYSSSCESSEKKKPSISVQPSLGTARSGDSADIETTTKNIIDNYFQMGTVYW